MMGFVSRSTVPFPSSVVHKCTGWSLSWRRIRTGGCIVCARRLIIVCVLLGGLLSGWLFWRGRSPLGASGKTPRATVTKQPVNFASRTFDPSSPSPEMPSLGTGEEAECDSNFLSNANVGGRVQKTDATHAFITITQIDVSLQLN